MASLTMISLPVFGFLNLHHGPLSISCAPNSFSPAHNPSHGKPTFGELHDIALVDDGDRFAIVVDGVLHCLADQAFEPSRDTV